MIRRVVVTLPPDAYKRLQAVAAREERTPDRQAAFLLRQLLADPADEAESVPAVPA